MFYVFTLCIRDMYFMYEIKDNNNNNNNRFLALGIFTTEGNNNKKIIIIIIIAIAIFALNRIFRYPVYSCAGYILLISNKKCFYVIPTIDAVFNLLGFRIIFFHSKSPSV